MGNPLPLGARPARAWRERSLVTGRGLGETRAHSLAWTHVSKRKLTQRRLRVPEGLGARAGGHSPGLAF